MSAIQRQARHCETLADLAELMPETAWGDTGRQRYQGMPDCGTGQHAWRYDAWTDGADTIAERTCRCCGQVESADLGAWMECEASAEVGYRAV